MKIHSLSLLSALLSPAIAASSSSNAGLLSNKNGISNHTHDSKLSKRTNMQLVSLGDWQAAYEKATKFVAKLNTTEKLKLITGSDATTTDGQSFTALEFLDGSMGLQGYYYVSAFCQSSALAMTWDKSAMYAQSQAVATEAYLKGIQVIAGPTSQPLGRTPWGGRLVETYGSDPYLNGIASGLSVEAYNDVGVIAGAKVR
jgi:beta-glucosidase